MIREGTNFDYLIQGVQVVNSSLPIDSECMLIHLNVWWAPKYQIIIIFSKELGMSELPIKWGKSLFTNWLLQNKDFTSPND